jgi:hypothetical protein
VSCTQRFVRVSLLPTEPGTIHESRTASFLGCRGDMSCGQALVSAVYNAHSASQRQVSRCTLPFHRQQATHGDRETDSLEPISWSIKSEHVEQRPHAHLALGRASAVDFVARPALAADPHSY